MLCRCYFGLNGFTATAAAAAAATAGVWRQSQFFFVRPDIFREYIFFGNKTRVVSHASAVIYSEETSCSNT